MGVDECEKPLRSGNRVPKDVLNGFCHEFRSTWTSLSTAEGSAIQAEETSDDEFYLAIDRIRLTLLSLDSLVTAAYRYVDRLVSDPASPLSSELSILANITHDLKHDVSVAKSFSDLLIQDRVNKEDSLQNRTFLMRRLRRIDFLVREAFPVILSQKDYLKELDLAVYHSLL